MYILKAIIAFYLTFFNKLFDLETRTIKIRVKQFLTLTTPSKPGIVLTFAFLANNLLSILSPMAWIAYMSGPMKTTSSAACGEIQAENYNKNIMVLNIESQFYKKKSPHIYLLIIYALKITYK